MGDLRHKKLKAAYFVSSLFVTKAIITTVTTGIDNKNTEQPYIASKPIFPGVSMKKPLFQNSRVVNFKKKYSTAHLATGYKKIPKILINKKDSLYLKLSFQQK
ncbi:hypothetical protein GCM10009131_05180 [Morganella psychrotolerans]